MTFKILNPGLFSTVQDLGREGYQSEGFSQAGAVDYFSHCLANQLLNNDFNAPTIEMNFQGIEVKVLKNTFFATAGSDIEIIVNGETHSSKKALYAFKGDEIKFGKCSQGVRTYLSVPGGFDVPEILNSCSTHTRSGIGGFYGRTLKEGDILQSHGGRYYTSLKVAKPVERDEVIRVIPGQQFNYFDDDSKKEFFNTEYQITKESDRMGMRLNGSSLKSSEGHDVLSEPTQLGSVQVPKNGQPIILLNDRQTAGGYTRIGTIALCDIPKLAQMSPGTMISFEEITVKEAEKEYVQMLKDLQSEKYLTLPDNFNDIKRLTAYKISKMMG